MGQLSQTQIDGTLLPPKTIVITYDDAPYEKWQSSDAASISWTLDIARYLASVERPDEEGRFLTRGVPALILFVSCHFNDQPAPSLPPPTSVICMGARDQDELLLNEVVNLGPHFLVGNHSHSHIPASLMENDQIFAGTPWTQQDLFRYELCQTQSMLNKYQRNGWHFYRAPGLDWPEWAAGVANGDPCTDHLQGPLGVDVGGAFVLDDGSVMGGDWDCPNQGLTAEACGDLYLRDIRAVTPYHGAILLLHNYVIPGDYAMGVIKRIMENLDQDIKVVDIRTHPAFRGMAPSLFPVRHSESLF